jgi:hypothetical protein
VAPKFEMCPKNLYSIESCSKVKNVPTKFKLVVTHSTEVFLKGISTVDLLVQISLDQHLVILKISFTFVTKHTILMRRSTVLSLAPQLLFPAHNMQNHKLLEAGFNYGACTINLFAIL